MLSVSHSVGYGGDVGGGTAFVWKYCRMCALEVKQGVYIFGEEGKRLHIPEKIRKTVAILVLEEDSLPKKICTSCCTSLEAYTQFKDSVVDAQEKLSAIAKSIEKCQEQQQQQQNLLQIRHKQIAKSPKRQKVYPSGALGIHSTSPPSSSSALASSTVHQIMLPTPSVISGPPEPDLCEPTIECHGGSPASVPSGISSDSEDDHFHEESNPTQKSSPVEVNEAKSDEPSSSSSTVQGTISPIKYPPKTNEPEDSTITSYKSVSSKSPVYNGETSSSNSNSSSSSSGGNNDANASASSEDSQQPNLLCGLCSSHFKDKDSLIAHHLKSHNNSSSGDSQNEPIFGCSGCPRLTPNYEALRQHMHRHRAVSLFKCPDCDKGFTTKDHLHVHITSKHNQALGKATKVSTPISSIYPRKSSPNQACSENVACAAPEESSGHSQPEAGPSSVNNSLSPVKCLEKSNDPAAAVVKLDLTISSSSSASRNNSTFSGDQHEQQPQQKLKPSINEKDDKDGYWKCVYCDKILRSKNGYDTHMATHKGRRFTCAQCGVSYTQKSSLEHHIKVHHTNIGKEFECPECNKTFKTFRQLGWHRKTHEKPLTDVRCPQCEKLFKNMVSFKTHLKLHRGSKKFACTECPKAFYTKAKLQEHLNSHSGRRPFGCPVENCSKVFSCFSNYAKHFKKQHQSLIGPKGRMIPPPKMVETNNNLVVPLKSAEPGYQKKTTSPATPASLKTMQSTTAIMPTPISSSSTSNSKPDTVQIPTQSSCDTHSNSTSSLHPSFQISSASDNNPSTQTQTVLRSLPAIFSATSSANLQTASTSSQTFGSQPSCNSINMLGPTNSHNPNSPLPLHLANSNSGSSGGGPNENLSMAHAQSSQSVPISTLQSHSHHHLHHVVNVHAHSGHSSHAPTQFQSPNHIQTVWQPVVLPSSKTYHNSNNTPSASTNLTTINSLDLLDCAANVHSSESLSNSTSTSNATSSNNNHSQQPQHHHHQQASVSINNPATINAAHLATSHSSVVHAHHGQTMSAHFASGHLLNNHHNSNGNSSNSATSSSSAHNNNNSLSTSTSTSSSSSTVNIPPFGSLTQHHHQQQQSEPMELSYKDSNNFQEMPMELTKVFQRDPLELCVRQDFANTQPLMDLSSRVVNVTVGGNSSMNVSTMSMNLNGNNASSSSTGGTGGTNSNAQSHCNSINNGNGGNSSNNTSNSTSILSVPYHKTTELVERELTLNDFTGAFRQPIDLISRTEDQSHELCSEGSLVDLSLRSSFGQDQSASSFLRELIDLSSRSDSFHGEVNLTNKPHHHHPQSSSNSHSQIHHSSHNPAHHPLSKPTPNSIGGHHHHSNSHHHHTIQSHQSSSSGTAAAAAAASLQSVMYPDASTMFN